jgi:F0F1-type ATP synthase assembly protein I
MDRSEEKKRKDRTRAARLLSMVSQFAFTMLSPMLLCFFGGMWLDKHLGTSFLAVLLFFVGALAGFTGVYRLAKEIMKDNDDEPSGKGLGTQDVSSSVDRDSDKLHHS